MSLETGKKLGLTASLISVIVPVVIVVLYGVLFFSLISTISSTVSSNPPSASPFSAFSGSGFFVAIALLGILSLAAIILFLIAMHSLSHYYSEPRIFRNALYGFLTNIIGGAVLIVIAAAFVFSIIHSVSTGTSIATAIGVGIALLILAAVVGALVIGIVSGIFYMRAFHALGDKSGVNNFQTAGTLYLVGSILQIVFFGSLILWIGWIFAAIGFNSLKPKTAESSMVAYPPPQQPTYSTGQTKYCPNCGAANNSDALYCRSCGKPLQ